jgi:His/Glu/Gln/Arg/opine family amino acid ABC transporter permease subunit
MPHAAYRGTSGRAMSFDILIRYGDRLFDGTLITLKLVGLASLIGLAIAVPVALARVSRRSWLRAPAYAYVYVFRGTPLLVQLFLIYYGLGQFQAVRDGVLWPLLRDAQFCGLLGLTLNTAAYTAEILRGGILAVPRGEVEAAQAAGMSPALAFRRILLPRAARIAWPAYGNEVVLLLKGSALVSTITVWDLMGETRSIFARGYDLMVFVWAGVFYFLLSAAVTICFRLAERRLNRYLGPARRSSAGARKPSSEQIVSA